MSSEIKANLIKDKSGTKTLATLSSSAVTLDSSVVFPAGGTGNPISVAVIADELANSNNAGGATAGSFQTRNLNTKISDPDGIVSISSNQFTLGAGTYHIYWQAPNYRGNAHKTALVDVTAGAYLEMGSNAYSGGDSGLPQTISNGSFIHAPSGSNVYEIRHRCERDQASNGFGVASSFTQVEIYTLVVITKLK